jgi:hypothetical protein
MVVNFRIHGISQGIRKLTRTPTSIIIIKKSSSTNLNMYPKEKKNTDGILSEKCTEVPFYGKKVVAF